MISPYHFYFIFVPRRTSNLREVRFGEVAILKQISALHHKNSWKFSEYLFDLKFLVHIPQVISKLSLVLHFSIWATEGPRKNRPLSAVLFWQISATICVYLSIAFFEFFLSRNFWGSCYSSICFICGDFEFEIEQKKGWFTIMFMLTLLIELCEVLYEESFVDGDLVVSNSFAIILVSCNSSPHLLSILINSDNVSAVIQVLQWLTFLITVNLPWSDGCKIGGTKLTELNGTTVLLYCGIGTKIIWDQYL
jgi:hypothetical protein